MNRIAAACVVASLAAAREGTFEDDMNNLTESFFDMVDSTSETISKALDKAAEDN